MHTRKQKVLSDGVACADRQRQFEREVKEDRGTRQLKIENQAKQVGRKDMGWGKGNEKDERKREKKGKHERGTATNSKE